jgi:hypothetical protein
MTGEMMMSRNAVIGLVLALTIIGAGILLILTNNLSQAELTLQAAQGTLTAQSSSLSAQYGVATGAAATLNSADVTQSALESSLSSANAAGTQQANDAGTAQAISSATQVALEGNLFGLGVTATVGAENYAALQTQSMSTQSALEVNLATSYYEGTQVIGTATAVVETLAPLFNNQQATNTALEVNLATQQAVNVNLSGTVVAIATEATVAALNLGTAQAELAAVTEQAPLESVATPVANLPIDTLIYHETFESSSQWPVGNVRGAGNAALLNGQYVLTIDQTGGSIQVHNPPSLTNSYAEVEVDLTDCAAGGFVGVLARTQQSGSGSYFAAFACDFSFGGIILLSAGQEPRALNTVNLPPIDTAQIHVIGVKTEGDTITVYLDGTELVSATDATYSAGSIGLYAGTTANSLVVRFDNLRVWALP